MRNQGLLLVGVVLITAGVLFLIGSIFNIDIGAWCWPIGLILLGLFLFLRPRTIEKGTASQVILIGEEERAGAWTVRPEEFWYFIADMDLDFTKADVPLGDTRLRLIGFIGDIELTVPANIGLNVRSTSFVTSMKEVGQPDEDTVLGTVQWQSAGGKGAERQVWLKLTGFISEVKIRVV